LALASLLLQVRVWRFPANFNSSRAFSSQGVRGSIQRCEPLAAFWSGRGDDTLNTLFTVPNFSLPAFDFLFRFQYDYFITKL
jgi:hypothetical protein